MLSLKSRFDNRVIGIAMLVVTYFLFTVTDTLAKHLRARFSAFELVGVLGFSFAFYMGLYTIIRRRSALLQPQRLWVMILRGCFACGNAFAGYYAYAHMPLMNVYSIYFFSPVLVMLFSALLLRERVTWQGWLAVITGFAGILIMLRPGTVPLEFPVLIALLTPLTQACSIITMRFASRTDSNEAILFYGGLTYATISAFVMIPFFVMPTASEIVLLAAMGFVATIGWFLVVEGFRRATTPVGAPFQYTQLIWGVLFGWVLWHHVPDLWTITGSAVVTASGLFTLWHEVQRKRHAVMATMR